MVSQSLFISFIFISHFSRPQLLITASSGSKNTITKGIAIVWQLMTGMVKQVPSQERCVDMPVKSPEMISYCPASESLIHCLMFGPRCVALK